MFPEKMKREELKLKGVLEDVDYSSSIIEYRAHRLKKAYKNLYNEDVNPNIAIDVFYTWYLPHPIIKDKVNSRLKYNKLVLSKLMALDDYESLKYNTMVDTASSFSYTIVFMKKLIDLLKREFFKSIEGESKSNVHTLKDILDHITLGNFSNTMASNILKDLNADTKEVQEQSNITEDLNEVLEQIVSKAHNKARQVAENIKELKNIVGGNAAGTQADVLTMGDFLEEAIRLAESSDVTEILKLVKGLIDKTPMFLKHERKEYKHGIYDGITTGRDISRILPRELALPSDVFYKKYVDGELLLRRRITSFEKGPLYVLIDKSSSMAGEKTIWARAIALALFRRARVEKREFYLRFFDYIPHDLAYVSRKARAEEVQKLYRALLTVISRGGTCISRAIATACQDIINRNVKDVSTIILITDGRDILCSEEIMSYLNEANAELVSIMIRGENESLRKVSKKYFIARVLDTREALEIIAY